MFGGVPFSYSPLHIMCPTNKNVLSKDLTSTIRYELYLFPVELYIYTRLRYATSYAHAYVHDLTALK